MTTTFSINYAFFIPVHNCANVCIEPVDVESEAAVYAQIELTFDATSSVDGETFTLAGHTFYVVDGATLGGSEVDLVATNANTRATNFAAAIAANPYFNVLVTRIANVVTIDWPEAKEIPNWLFDFSGLTGAPTIAATNGKRVQVNAKIGYNIFAGTYLFNLNAADILTSDTTPLSYCFNYQRELMLLVDTSLPDLLASVVADSLFSKKIKFAHGLIDSPADGCGPVFKSWLFTRDYVLTNQQFTGQQLLTYAQYYNYAGIKFSTIKQSGSRICYGQPDWLWIVLYGTFNSASVIYAYYDENDVQIYGHTEGGIAAEGTYIVPSGININNLGVAVPWANVAYYTVKMAIITPLTSYVGTAYKYYLVQKCCDSYSIYFSDPLGGYTLLPCSELESIGITTSGDEILKDISCGGERMTNYAADETLSITTTLRVSDANIALLSAFKKANKLLLYDGYSLIPAYKDAGATRIYEKDSVLKLTTTIIKAKQLYSK